MCHKQSIISEQDSMFYELAKQPQSTNDEQNIQIIK